MFEKKIAFIVEFKRPAASKRKKPTEHEKTNSQFICTNGFFREA